MRHCNRISEWEQLKHTLCRCRCRCRCKMNDLAEEVNGIPILFIFHSSSHLFTLLTPLPSYPFPLIIPLLSSYLCSFDLFIFYSLCPADPLSSTPFALLSPLLFWSLCALGPFYSPDPYPVRTSTRSFCPYLALVRVRFPNCPSVSLRLPAAPFASEVALDAHPLLNCKLMSNTRPWLYQTNFVLPFCAYFFLSVTLFRLFTKLCLIDSSISYVIFPHSSYVQLLSV